MNTTSSTNPTSTTARAPHPTPAITTIGPVRATRPRALVWLAHAAFGLFIQATFGCARAPEATEAEEAPKTMPVRTAPVERARWTPAIHAIGSLSGKEELRLSFKVGGIVERVFVDEGAAVGAGQQLAALRLPEVGAAVTQTRGALEKAERDLARAKDLFSGRAATLEQVQDATTAVDVARAAATSAAFNAEHAVIRAPAAGKILRRFVERDESVSSGAPVLLLRSTARGWILRAGVSDRDVLRVALGDPATLTFEALPGRTFAASVSEIAETASATTGTYDLELRLHDPAATAALRSGLIAEALIHPAATETYAFVPIGALLDGDDRRASVFVPVADAGGARADRRAITIAYLDGERVAVAAGLDGVSSVVTDGAARLVPGAPIEIVPATDSPNGGLRADSGRLDGARVRAAP